MYDEMVAVMKAHEEFNTYLACFPLTAEQATHHLSIVEQTWTSWECSALLAGRDALARLQAIALEGGFVGLAHVLYSAYEGYCQCLTGYL